jgi:hypothetical protein
LTPPTASGRIALCLIAGDFALGLEPRPFALAGNAALIAFDDFGLFPAPARFSLGASRPLRDLVGASHLMVCSKDRAAERSVLIALPGLFSASDSRWKRRSQRGAFGAKRARGLMRQF